MKSVNFDHLIFDAADYSLSEASEALNNFNCIQLKRAVDTDLIALELKKFLRESIDGATSSNHLKLNYDLNESSGQIRHNLIAALRSDALFALLSKHFNQEIFSLSHYCGSGFRLVKRTVPVSDELIEKDIAAEPWHQDSRACRPEQFGPMLIVWILLSPQSAGSGLAP